jgi:hypothetical protein
MSGPAPPPLPEGARSPPAKPVGPPPPAAADLVPSPVRCTAQIQPGWQQKMPLHQARHPTVPAATQQQQQHHGNPARAPQQAVAFKKQ